jgi:amidase
VVDVDLAIGPELVEAFADLLAIAASMAPATDEAQLMPFTRALRQQARRLDPDALARCRSLFGRTADRLGADAFRDVDLLLTPTLAQPPAPIGAFTSGDLAVDFAAMSAFMPFPPLANIIGGPSVSLPGFGEADGLPVGVMLTGPAGTDVTLLAVAEALLADTAWEPPPRW